MLAELNREVCDPDEGHWFLIDGVRAPAFELPDGRMFAGVAPGGDP